MNRQGDLLDALLRGGVDAVVRGRNGSGAAVENHTGPFQALIAGGHRDIGTAAALFSQGQVIVRVEGVVPGGDGVGPGADRHIAVGVDRVVGAVEGEGAAADEHRAVGLDALGAVVGAQLPGVGSAAEGLDIKGAPGNHHVSGALDAVALGVDGDLAAVDGDGSGGLGVVLVGLGLDAVIPGGDVHRAAVNHHGVVPGDAVVGGFHVHRHAALYGNPGAGRALDAVLAGGAVQVQGARAADGQGRAGLHLNHRALELLRVLIGGIFLIRQGDGTHGVESDVGSLVAGEGCRGAGSQGQILKNQRDAGGALLHGDAALRAGAGDGIDAGFVDGQGRALNLVPALRAGGRDAAVGKRQGHGTGGDADGSLGSRGLGAGGCIGGQGGQRRGVEQRGQGDGSGGGALERELFHDGSSLNCFS